MDILTQPWPWYVAGPLIGLVVPALLLFGGKRFGLSTSFQHICAATLPAGLPYLTYAWRRGTWLLVLVAGLTLGGLVAAVFFTPPDYVVAISESTRNDLSGLGIRDFGGLVPSELLGWGGLLTAPGIIMIVVGGFLVGFGTRYANGCTSGHGITGLAMLERSAMIALVGFFAGGLVTTHLLLPVLLGGGS